MSAKGLKLRLDVQFEIRQTRSLPHFNYRVTTASRENVGTLLILALS